MSMEDVWVLADDRPGNVAQALGVAEALGRPFAIKDIRYDRWGAAPNLVRGRSLLGVAAASRQLLTPPWPRLVIAAGRRTAPVARWLKRRSGAALVQLMDPGWPGRGDFDLIAKPRHDDDGMAAGGRIMVTLGACHRASPVRLAEAARLWAPRLAHLPRPYLLVVVGGGTKDRPFDAALARQLAAGMTDLRQRAGGSVLMTTSRRTPPEAERILFDAATEPAWRHSWQAGGDNPYPGFLALADSLLVTGDSMSMCSEACANGGPVFIFAPAGMVSDKHARLHQALYERGFARPLGGDPTVWRHPPLNAAEDVAREIVQRGLI